MTAESDDLLGMEVDMEASANHFVEDDYDTEPVSTQFTEVPEITEDDMMLQLDSEVGLPEADLQDEELVGLEADMSFNPLSDGYVEAEDDFYLEDDEAAFAQLDQHMANEDEYLLLDDQFSLH